MGRWRYYIDLQANSTHANSTHINMPTRWDPTHFTFTAVCIYKVTNNCLHQLEYVHVITLLKGAICVLHCVFFYVPDRLTFHAGER